MKSSRIILTIIVSIMLGAAFLVYGKAQEIGKVIAYPNPFDPDTQTLTIKPSSGTFAGTVQYTVYDFNQKKIYEGSVSSSNITWSGHDSSGSRVSPGLYFIRLRQTFTDGSVGVKYIKVLVH